MTPEDRPKESSLHVTSEGPHQRGFLTWDNVRVILDCMNENNVIDISVKETLLFQVYLYHWREDI